MNRQELGMRALPWVQRHSILRRATVPQANVRLSTAMRQHLVSDNEAVEELCDAILPLPSPPMPMRRDAVETYIKSWRDRPSLHGTAARDILDLILDDYRLHADLGAALGDEVTAR